MNKKLLILILIITAAIIPVFSLEIGTYFNIGNMSFEEKPLTSTTFPSDKLPWGLEVAGTQNVGEGLRVDFGYKDDPILNHLAYGNFTYTGEFFSMGAGPAFGIMNTTETITQPGISTNFKLELPGLAFINFDLLSSIGYTMSSEGDYSQNQSTISLGFYIPNAICTLNLVEKKYNVITSKYGELQDSMTEYSFKSEIYKKNIPFRLLIGVLYRTTGSDYVNQQIVHTGATFDELDSSLTDITLEQTMNSILLQTRVDFSLTSWLTMIIDVNSSIFQFGSIDNEELDTKETMQFNEDDFPDSYLFEASIGFSVDMENLNNL